MRNRVLERADELEGYLDLGMAEEALRVSRSILKRRPVSGWAFAQAVEAILIQADRLKLWRRRIESAYETLAPKEQKQAAAKMLHFYVSVGDWDAAARFLPARPANPATLLFSIWTLLNLRDTERAKQLHKTCLRWLRARPDDFSVSCLLEALGSYYAQAGEWRLAQAAWESGQDYPTFAENAWDGLVKLHAYRGLLQANVAFDAANSPNFLDDDGLMLPRNSAQRCADVDKEFHRYARDFARVIPAKERWKFGGGNRSVELWPSS